MNNIELSILVVDDDENIRLLIKRHLEMENCIVDVASSGEEAIKKFDVFRYDIVFTDLKMPGIDGIEVMKAIKNVSPETAVIILTGYGTIENAVEAMKNGADDYISKPFEHIELKKIIDRIKETKSLKIKYEQLSQEFLRKNVPEIIGQSRKILEVLSNIRLASDSEASVMITGESGTGKDLAARAIHYLSSRSKEPFIVINCASVPRELLESEFFGYERGAFSGAIKKKYGLFEVANKGTLFLDEISEMPLELQSKILRAIETKKIRRLGSTKEIEIDIRIISATNKDINEEIKKKRFRNDLFYRIGAFIINIPPLRERKEDIPLLVEYFLKIKNKSHLLPLSDNILTILKNYSWPGNIRELQNTIEYMLIVSKGSRFEIKHLPAQIKEKSNHPSSEKNISADNIKALEEYELDYIKSVYESTGKDKEKTAEILGIGIATLYRKIKKIEN